MSRVPCCESLDLPLGVGAGDVWRRTSRDHVHGPGGARRLDADGRTGAMRSPARRARARDPRHRRAQGGVCTVGRRRDEARHCDRRWSRRRRSLLDQRHLDADSAGRDAHRRAGGSASASRPRRTIDVACEGLADRADPLPPRTDRARRRSHPRGAGSRTGCRQRSAARCGRSRRAGVPTIMLFVQSLRGLSHKSSRTRRRSTSRWPSRPSTGYVEDDRLARVKRKEAVLQTSFRQLVRAHSASWALICVKSSSARPRAPVEGPVPDRRARRRRSPWRGRARSGATPRDPRGNSA